MITNLSGYQNELLLLVLALFIITIASLLLYVGSLHKRIVAIPHLTLSEDILTRLSRHDELLASHENGIAESGALISTLQQKQTLSYKSFVHRYNPFRESGVGGNQSFSIVLADSHGDGLLISSLYSREMNRVSAKPLSNWKNDEYTISPEEQHAINQLMNR